MPDSPPGPPVTARFEEPRPGPRARWPVMIAVGVIAITLGIGGGFLLTALVDRGAGSGSQSPSDVVRRYLQAVAAGDAETALDLGAGRPADTTLMTPEILARANEYAPITEINVPDTDSTVVPVSFRIGTERVNTEILVVDTNDGPRLQQTWGVMRLKPITGRDLPRLVYGMEITAEQIPVFPGAYPVQTGHRLIDWGENATGLIRNPESFSSGNPDLQPRLTEDGEREFEQATAQFLQSCLDGVRLSPDPCPFNVRTHGADPAAAIEWSTPDGDPMTGFEPGIDYDNVHLATARFDFPVVARWEQDGRTMNAERWVHGRATMDLTDQDAPVFAWRE